MDMGLDSDLRIDSDCRILVGSELFGRGCSACFDRAWSRDLGRIWVLRIGIDVLSLGEESWCRSGKYSMAPYTYMSCFFVTSTSCQYSWFVVRAS